jgi:tRNA(Ile)-lysidine synthase
MAASPTPRPKPAEAGANPARAPLQALHPDLPVAVAFSGGADSTALVLAACALWPGRVSAIHVHHGLQAAADGFQARCEAVCTQLQVPLQVVRVDARHAPGQSPEEAARRARYEALAGAARTGGARAVLLAQHADDQVETLLLALSRGAGLPGLAAMPATFERHGVRFHRPLLRVPGPSLRSWLAGAGIPFAEDPANADPRFTRSRIRHEVLPALDAAFPSWRETFARSAAHAAQAQALLAEFAALDLAEMEGAPRIDTLRQWSRERQANLLRHWLRSVHGAAASTVQLEEALDQVADCTTAAHRLHIRVGNGVLERQGARLTWSPSV